MFISDSMLVNALEILFSVLVNALLVKCLIQEIFFYHLQQLRALRMW